MPGIEDASCFSCSLEKKNVLERDHHMTVRQLCWTKEHAWEWYHSRPIPYGFNFLPSTAVNSTEMWQEQSFDEETIARELRWATQYGFNSCRVFLQYLLWEENASAYKTRIEQFLAIATRYGILTMLILFDDCAFAGKEPHLGPQDAPVPGIHNSGWTPSPGPMVADNSARWGQLEAYVKDIVGTFATDMRILMWDIYNEPGNNERGTKSLSLLEHAFSWARDAKPIQPLTSGVWGCQETDARCLALSDIVTFHTYDDAHTLRLRIHDLKRHNSPLVCTEWMARTRGSRFETHVPIFAEEAVGCYMWGLVNGKTQTHLPWGSSREAPASNMWFHDLLYPDGTPYSQAEIESIQRYRTCFARLSRA